MQRWILIGVIGCVLLVAMGFGAKYARDQYRLTRPSGYWMPVGLNQSMSIADQKKLADQLKEKITTDDFLRAVVKDLGLQKEFELSSEDLAIKQLRNKVFVEIDSMDSPEGRVPTVNIGMRGIGREKQLLQKGAERIMQDVWPMIGIDPKTGKPLNPETPANSAQ